MPFSVTSFPRMSTTAPWNPGVEDVGSKSGGPMAHTTKYEPRRFVAFTCFDDFIPDHDLFNNRPCDPFALPPSVYIAC